MRIEQSAWAQYGKLMMVVSGLACLALALSPGEGPTHLFLRVYVGFFGVANIVFAFSHRGRES